MQIGNRDLDTVYEQVIVPAINACGLHEKRVDKHNKGGLLKSEIIGFINDSEIVVADLTNERPNCYLEVGYTMGHTGASNSDSKLILTCREDHNPDSPNHSKDGPKIHFDLSGYDICYWDPSRLEDFREELVKRIRRRRKTLVFGSRKLPDPFKQDWLAFHRSKAIAVLGEIGKKGFMEGIVAPVQSGSSWNLDQLSRAATAYRSTEFPFGEGQTNEKRLSAGLVREQVQEDKAWYLYWVCQKDGTLYTLASLPEEMHSTGGALSAYRRIIQVADLLVSSHAFYCQLGLPPDSPVDISVQHGGVLQRTLKNTRYGSKKDYGSSAEDVIVSNTSRISIGDLGNKTEWPLKELCDPFFEIFGFPAPQATEYKQFITSLRAGNMAVWYPG